MRSKRTIRTYRRRWTITIVVALGVSQCTPAVLGWSRLGHRVIAKLAEKQLNPKARAAMAELLEPGESLADSSTWADEHRREIPGSIQWHFMTVPVDQARYDELTLDERRGNLIFKFREFRSILEDPSQPVEERRIALRFVVHLVGDVHQPLHVGDLGDRGGNRTQVRFYRRATNLHRVWDEHLIERASRDEDRWVAHLLALDTPAHRAETLRGTIGFWATESVRAARQAYLDPETGRWIRSGARLGDAYVEANLLVVRRRLYQAGIRLGRVLNEVWPDE